MIYELAKELKDAGFPQKSGFHASNAKNCNCNTRGLATSCHLAYLPTLSELIEACGEGFESLVRADYEDIGVEWEAYPTDKAYKGDCIAGCCGYETGDTPEEAVARLWLALNSK